MSNFFHVDHTFVDLERSLFILAGKVSGGVVLPEMSLLLDLNDRFSMTLLVTTVESVAAATGELTGLCISFDDEGEAEILQQLDLAGEDLVVVDC